MSRPRDTNPPHDDRPLPLVMAEIALVFAVFFLQGAWPVPDVNETVYLAHMKHFWSPQWAPGDLYLQSGDAHLVSNWVMGWPTLFLSMPAFAWSGRLLTWWLLAWSWRRLSFALVPRSWWSVISAGLFVCLQERCQMAGEWVIGGLEAKGPAYVLAFLALERLVRNQWNAVFALLGASGAFHVLVGGWSAIAAGLGWLMMRASALLRKPPPDLQESSDLRPPALIKILPGIVAGAVLALPGLWPAITLNADATAEQVSQANRIYVLERLPHHLAPQKFPDTLVFKMTLLWVAFAILWRFAPRDSGWVRLAAFVLGAMAITLAGWTIAIATVSSPETYAAWMRFYWFRLIDAAMPLGVALGAVHWIDGRMRFAPAQARLWLGVAVGIVVLHIGGYLVDRPFPTRPRPDRESKVADYTAWRHVCAWARHNTPADALFLTPRAPQSFRWYSSRGEVVNYKDLPQDALTMLRWKAAMKAVHGAPADSNPPRTWLKSLTERTPEDLRAVGQQFGAAYLVTDSTPPLDLPCLYRNDAYAVYSLGQPSQR